jgi:Mn-dependent DtxR family transcriptional regulator
MRLAMTIVYEDEREIELCEQDEQIFRAFLEKYGMLEEFLHDTSAKY